MYIVYSSNVEAFHFQLNRLVLPSVMFLDHVLCFSMYLRSSDYRKAMGYSVAVRSISNLQFKETASRFALSQMSLSRGVGETYCL